MLHLTNIPECSLTKGITSLTVHQVIVITIYIHKFLSHAIHPLPLNTFQRWVMSLIVVPCRHTWIICLKCHQLPSDACYQYNWVGCSIFLHCCQSVGYGWSFWQPLREATPVTVPSPNHLNLPMQTKCRRLGMPLSCNHTYGSGNQRIIANNLILNSFIFI